MTTKIPLSPVTSSQIHAIGHDPASHTLAVQFKSKGGAGATYHYPNFTADDYAKFQGAKSIGSHFGKYVRNNPKHPHTKQQD